MRNSIASLTCVLSWGGAIVFIAVAAVGTNNITISNIALQWKRLAEPIVYPATQPKGLLLSFGVLQMNVRVWILSKIFDICILFAY